MKGFLYCAVRTYTCLGAQKKCVLLLFLEAEKGHERGEEGGPTLITVEERAGGCQHQRKAGLPARSQVDSPTFEHHTQHCICIEPKRYYCSVIGLTTHEF